MLQFGVLSTFLDMLDRCSDETKQVTCQALVKFVQHGMAMIPSLINLIFVTSFSTKMTSSMYCSGTVIWENSRNERRVISQASAMVLSSLW